MQFMALLLCSWSHGNLSAYIPGAAGQTSAVNVPEVANGCYNHIQVTGEGGGGRYSLVYAKSKYYLGHQTCVMLSVKETTV